MLEQVKNSLPTKAKRAVELATEKGSSNWLTVIPLKELDYNLNKKDFRDAIKLQYNLDITDTPMLFVCSVQFSVDNLEAEMLRMVCNDVEVELVLQDVTRRH